MVGMVQILALGLMVRDALIPHAGNQDSSLASPDSSFVLMQTLGSRSNGSLASLLGDLD